MEGENVAKPLMNMYVAGASWLALLKGLETANHDLPPAQKY